jgi:glycolate oxidase FAD binding subunit
VIAQATFRLHPSVIARRVVSTPTDDPWPLVQAVPHTTAAPTAIEWYDDTLHVLVESSEAAVDPQTQRVAAAISGQVADQLPVGWEELHRPDGGMLVKLTYQLSGLASLPTAVRAVLPGARLRAHAGSGVMYVAAAADASAVDELRRIVGSLDGAAVVVAAAPEFLARVDRWGPVRGLDVMRRIKAEFDPERRMNPGRFVGDI